MRLIIFLIFISIFSSIACNAEIIGTLKPVTGIPRFGGIHTQKITSETPLKNGAIIKTGADATAKAIYNDGSTIVISKKTTAIFKKNSVRIKRGKTNLNFVKQKKTFRIFTPTASIGIYGTSLEIEVFKKGWSQIGVTEGKIWIQANYGNKRKINLEQGYKIAVTQDGIIGKPIGFKIDQKKAEIEIPPTLDEYVLDTESDLELNGNYSYRIEPILDNSFRILINGYSRLNGKELLFRNKETVILKGLEEDVYEITLIANGIENTFPLEINEKTNMRLLPLKYQRKVIGVEIYNLIGKKNQEEKRKHLKYTMIYKGKRIPITYRDVGDKINFGFETKRFGKDSIGRSLITLPKNLEEYPVLELEYNGDLPVKEKIKQIKFRKNKIFIIVRFK